MKKVTIPGPRRQFLSRRLVVPAIVFVIVLAIGVSAYYFISLRAKQARGDEHAHRSMFQMQGALGRLYNECGQAGCASPPPWFQEQHLMFLKGPYYGFRGGNAENPVRFRLLDGEIRTCAENGTSPKGGRTRWIYRCDMLSGAELPRIVGECTGQRFLGDFCFTESILDPKDCSFRFGPKHDPDWAKKCDQLIAGVKEQLPQQKALATKGINAMGVELYPKLGDPSCNLVFSPYGLYEQMAILYGGARSVTERELAGLLHVQEVGAPVHDVLASLRRVLACEASKAGGTLDIHTTLLVNMGEEALLPEYRNLARNVYDATIESGTSSLTTVNLVLFKNLWQDKFSESGTKDLPFYLLDGKQIEVPTMSQELNKMFRYMERRDFEALEMCYAGGSLSMVIFLPAKKDGLPQFERTVTNEKLEQWLADLESWGDGITVYIPRFRPQASHKVKNLMMANGLTSAYSPTTADFSGMVQGGLLPVHVEDQQQEVTMEVDEEGSQVIVVGINCLVIGGAGDSDDDVPRRKKGQPIVFRADHPFMFVIRHNATGCILVMGRVTNPLQ